MNVSLFAVELEGFTRSLIETYSRPAFVQDIVMVIYGKALVYRNSHNKCHKICQPEQCFVIVTLRLLL